MVTPTTLNYTCLYAKAKTSGLLIKPPIGIVDLINLLKAGEHIIVFYDVGQDEGHFSPVESVDSEKLFLPLDDNEINEILAVSDFIRDLFNQKHC